MSKNSYSDGSFCWFLHRTSDFRLTYLQYSLVTSTEVSGLPLAFNYVAALSLLHLFQTETNFGMTFRYNILSVRSIYTMWISILLFQQHPCIVAPSMCWLLNVRFYQLFCFVICIFTKSYYVYLKCITLSNCFSPSSSASLPHFSQNIGEVGAKKYFMDHRTVTTIQLLVTIKGNLSGLFFFFFLDKCTQLFICTALKQTLSSGQKPV